MLSTQQNIWSSIAFYGLNLSQDKMAGDNVDGNKIVLIQNFHKMYISNYNANINLASFHR